MLYVRQNATHKVVIGPVVAVGDGFTPVTTLSLASADEKCAILHDNGTVVSISGYTFAAITSADGYYHLTLQSGISGTVGHVTIVINDDSLCLPVKADFTVVEEAVYDMLFAASAIGYIANQPVDVNTIKTQTVTCGAGVTVYPAVGTTATVKSNHEIVFSTDFATNYDTTSDMWKVKLGDVAHGGTAGVLTLSRIIVASATTNEPAVKLTGNGVGGAIVATGGATGPGVEFIGGASGGNGMNVYSQAAATRGLFIQGTGSGEGVYIEGGGTGPGMYITGNTYGLEVHGGATNGTGIYATGGTATGYGIQAEAGSHAMYLHTTDGGDGIHFTGSLGGVGFVGDITGTLSTVTTLTNLPAITANWLTATGIASNAITSAKIASGAITTSTFASGAINAAAIAADAIGASELAADAVAEIADAVWDELLSGHAVSGSTGEALSAAGTAGDPWSTALPGAYSAGTAGYIVGTNIDALISSRGTSTLTQTQVTGGAYALNSSSFAFASALDFTTTQKTSIGTAVAASAVASVTGNVGGNVTGSVGSLATQAKADVNAEVLDVIGTDTLIDGKTISNALKYIAAGVVGRISGAGTGTEVFLGLDESTTRVTVTVDSSGNRTDIVYG